MKKSLQEIEDYYINRGLSGEKLRLALKDDKEYQKLLADKKSKISKKYGISKEEQEKYVLATEQDYEILSRCNKLLGRDISQSDRELVGFIKSQLLDEWRKSIFEILVKIERKYGHCG